MDRCGAYSSVDYNPNGYADEDGEVDENIKLFLTAAAPLRRKANQPHRTRNHTGKSYVFEMDQQAWMAHHWWYSFRVPR